MRSSYSLSTEMSCVLVTDGDWKVWVTTSESIDGGDIAMVVYGESGNSGPIILGKASETGLFLAGNQDNFKVNNNNMNNFELF